jgi:hypothetical protein
MSFTSDEVNYLIYRYLQESGIYIYFKNKNIKNKNNFFLL